MKPFSLSMLLAAAVLAAPHAQTPANPTYEVASVKPNKSGENRISFGTAPGGRFMVTNAPLVEILRNAYSVQMFQIVGAPDWIKSDRFDIVAKASGDIGLGPQAPFAATGPPTTQQLMLRALLADRFGLKVHNETREMPIYALVTARADKQPGSKLKPSTADCAKLMADMRARGGPGLMAPPKPGEPMPCGIMMGPGIMNVGSAPIAQLAANLSMRLGRVVIDRTGLTGNWDAMLTFQPEPMGFGPGGPPPGAPGPPPIDPNAPSLQAALEEQLGLKLESTKGPVDVLVIDAVSPPTPD